MCSEHSQKTREKMIRFFKRELSDEVQNSCSRFRVIEHAHVSRLTVSQPPRLAEQEDNFVVLLDTELNGFPESDLSQF